MPDFSRPEYQSYVALCLELSLAREWREFDLAVNRSWHVVSVDMVYERQTKPIEEYGLVWLPQLADWLDMLEAATDEFSLQMDGGNEPTNGTGNGFADQFSWTYTATWDWSDDRATAGASAPTYEEAVARLAIAVGAVKVPA